MLIVIGFLGVFIGLLLASLATIIVEGCYVKLTNHHCYAVDCQQGHIQLANVVFKVVFILTVIGTLIYFPKC